jgi:hypothetical protein
VQFLVVHAISFILGYIETQYVQVYALGLTLEKMCAEGNRTTRDDGPAFCRRRSM